MDTRLKRLYEAAYAGDVYSLNKLLEEDRLLLDRIVTTTEVNNNPLHIAAIVGHAGFAREILRRKPKLAREFNGHGMSPLHLVAAQGHFKVAEELLQVDAGLCYLPENKDGYLPVHIAVVKRRHDLVALLIEKCEDSLYERTYRSETLLHLAVKENCPETIDFLTARGVTQLILNEVDSNGNTCLHLAFAGRQQQVIKRLLSQADIDVNVVNSAGLTPLDVLLVTNPEKGDLPLGEMIRAHGGKTAKELDTSSATNLKTPQARVRSTPIKRAIKSAILTKGKETNHNIENNLMVVATLVATVTFAAALNPPGGSIQMPFNDEDRNNSTWFTNWKDMNSTYPAGSPVYMWQLRRFFKYDYFALFASITVISLCLVGGARRKKGAMMDLLILVLWSSIFFMVLAFTSALSIMLNEKENSKIDRDEIFRWIHPVFNTWRCGFAIVTAKLFGRFIVSLVKALRGKRNGDHKNHGSGKVKRFFKSKCVKRVFLLMSMMAIGVLVGCGIGLAIYDQLIY